MDICVRVEKKCGSGGVNNKKKKYRGEIIFYGKQRRYAGSHYTVTDV